MPSCQLTASTGPAVSECVLQDVPVNDHYLLVSISISAKMFKDISDTTDNASQLSFQVFYNSQNICYFYALSILCILLTNIFHVSVKCQLFFNCSFFII